jgi:hypothetical protein
MDTGDNMKHASRIISIGAAIALLPLTAAFAQGASFDSLDTNKDGKISKAEAAANESVAAQFSRYDVNGDGFIEPAEVGQANKAPTTSAPADSPATAPPQ